MKKTVLVTALATGLLLAACNTKEATVTNDAEETKVNTEESITENSTETTPEETPVETVETTEPTETDEPTPTETTDTVQATPAPAVVTDKQKVIYGGDPQAEYVLPKATVDYSYKANGPLTTFLLDQLNLTPYYNKHSVSADEKTITLDFKEDLLFSQLVQGSAGGYIFKEALVVTFFKNIPSLQTLKLRVEGQEAMSDHVSFTGEITRQEVEAAHPDL